MPQDLAWISSISTIPHSGCARSSDSVSHRSTAPQPWPPQRCPSLKAFVSDLVLLQVDSCHDLVDTKGVGEGLPELARGKGQLEKPSCGELWAHCSCAELPAWSTGSSRSWHNWHRTPQLNSVSVSQLRPLPPQKPLVCPTGAFTFSSQILRFDRSTNVRIWLRRNWSARSWDTWKAMRPGPGAIKKRTAATRWKQNSNFEIPFGLIWPLQTVCSSRKKQFAGLFVHVMSAQRCSWSVLVPLKTMYARDPGKLPKVKSCKEHNDAMHQRFWR